MARQRTAVLETVSPILSVADLADALDHYERVLGFEVAWTWGEPAHLACVCRDRVAANLQQSSDETPAPSHVYVRMVGVDEYDARLVGNGTRVAIPIADRPYGLRDVRILDP